MSAFSPEPNHPGIHRHEGTHCPHCGKYIDTLSPPVTSTGQTVAQPQDGDPVLCVSCVRFYILIVVDTVMAVRLPTAEEEDYLNWLYAAQIAIVRRRKNRLN